VLLAVLKYPVAHSQAANPAIVPRLDESLTSIRTLDLVTCKPPKCYFDDESDVIETGCPSTATINTALTRPAP
jgi:dGTPase